ncbi:MAG: DNA polymerase III subunit gamma/tau [Chloroflexi bacterium]|nr:DNA polymerase III subunit gamma/tau [Chloroflexota bacterium]MYD47812.1 DNA polymerase III subunit gamma/tau [Chloroflexota bacterium]
MTTAARVYYRKWRPGTFSDLAGQEHVGNTLRQAVMQGRVSHSYLFCGGRGSGKTTTARVLAKAVNCLDPQQGDPCDRCAICVSINEGRNLDIIELDAASNRGVEEIREIRDKVHFQPAQNRRKVYIIDEAHMLTREASNAFLKTLEEPPDHVIFILCTTEADRILPTILSRCQRYDFRRLPGQTIYDRLAYITDQEAIAIHPDAMRMIARNAGGSMRDALNILEQLAVSTNGEITLRDVEESLGLVRSDAYLALSQKLLAGDTAGALETINQVVWEGGEPRQLHRQTLDLLRSMLLLSWDAGQTLDLTDDTQAGLAAIIRQTDSQHILRAVRIWGEAAAGLRYDAPAALPLEIAAAEICRPAPLPNDVPAEAPAAPPTSAPAPNRPPANGGRQPAQQRPAPPPQPAGGRPRQDNPGPPPRQPAPSPSPSDSQPAPSRTPSAAPDSLQGHWEQAVRQLGLVKGSKYNLGALLRDCRSGNVHLSADDSTLVLPFSNAANLDRMQEELNDPRVRDTIEQAIEESFGSRHPFQVTLAGANGDGAPPARNPVQDSPLVRTAMGLGARILDEQ